MSGPAASATYFLSPLVAATLTIVLAVLVVQAGVSERNRRMFLLVLLSLAAWALFTFGMRTSRTLEAAWVWNRLVAVCLLSLFVTYFHFCHLYMGSRRRWPILFLYLFAVPAAVIVLFTRLAVRGMSRAAYGYSPEVGLAGSIIFGAVYVLMGVNLVRLLRARRRFAAFETRTRLLVLAVAGLLPLFGMLADGFTDLPPVGIWTHLAFCTVCTFAILRYRLFDLHVVARKGLIHLLVGTLIAAPFVGMVLLADNLFSDRASLAWIYAGAMLVFALLLWPAYEWARRRVDRLLFSARHDLLEHVRQLARHVDAGSDFEEVGCRLTEIVSQALRASSVILLQAAGEARELRVAARDGRTATSEPVLQPEGPIVRWLSEQRRTLHSRALSVDPSLQNVSRAERDALDALAPVLLAPLVTPRGHLSGVLVVGAPRSRRSYSTEDSQLLDSLGGEAALALENARLYRDALRARETLHAWLDNLPDAVLIVDGAGVVRFLNREGARRFGARTGQRSFLARVPGPGNGNPQRFAETIRGREYEIASAPLVGPDGELSTVFVMRDVSERQEERRQREQLEARARLASHLASVGEMASGIAHEINNPLTAVVGYSEMLAAYPLPAEARETVEMVLQGANRVAAIVRRLLTFARQQKVERAPVDINEIVQSTLALRAYVLRTGNIRVTTELDPDLPPTVADGQQLQQVLLNLIVNAEKAIRGASGKGEIAVLSSREGDSLLIRVRDNGPGIPLEIQDRIFDPFFTTRDIGEGTGLGLSICHGIVTEHGGRISVHSRPGGGAEFVVELPLVPAGPSGEGTTAPAAAAGPAGARILVVDDEPSVRTLLRRILEGAGHRVDTAAGGTEALARVETHRYSLILMDVRMPGLNGIEVFHRIAQSGRSVGCGVVFLTGDVMDPETQELIGRTGAPVITKPFHTGEVLQLVAGLLENNR